MKLGESNETQRTKRDRNDVQKQRILSRGEKHKKENTREMTRK
jgi:hypothetical protein